MKSMLRMAVIGVCLLWSGLAANAAEPSIHWATSWAAAKAQARQSNKLIMADFYTDWCGWCKKLDADTYADKKVIQMSEQVVAVKLNAEKEGRAAAQRYKVQGYPTIVFINPAADGKDQSELAGEIVGYLPPAGFVDQATQIMQSAKDFPLLYKRFQKDPHDVEAIGKLVTIYHLRQDDQRARNLLDEGDQLDPNNEKGYLTKAYNAVADSYQSNNEFDKAIPLFQKAAATGKQPADIAYARMSIAACYVAQQRLDDAAGQLRAVLAMPDASKEDKEQAQEMLTQIGKAGS